MDIKQRIEDLRLSKKIPKMDFYEQVGMTSKGFNQMFENNSIKLSTLQKIAELLEVPITYFFTENKPKVLTVADLQQKVSELYEENRQLMKENKKLMEQNAELKESQTIPNATRIGKLKS